VSRTKLDEERIPQILEAFQRCIVKYGLAESSLERVAEEAGLSRTLIHHYIGGRNALLERWLIYVTRQRETLLDQAEVNSLEELLEQLQRDLDSQNAAPDSRTIQNELEAASARDPDIRDILKRRVERFVQLLTLQLGKLYPAASEAQCAEAAYLLIALSQGHTYLQHKCIPAPGPQPMRRAVQALLSQVLSRPAE
jgi:AcrR family transcriptional regulator